MTRVMLESGIGPLGELVFASSMVGVDPRDRPRVRCPECDDLLTFKAGERGIITPHVAHRSGSACAATNPETAAHFNAKMLLTRALNTSGTLRLRTKCYRFGHHVEADWHVPAWQRAEAEFRVETRRPDVAVFGEGDAVAGAVEVLHTHRVDRRKASDYAASGLPWVEFRAEHVLAWDGKGALPVEAADRETLRELVRSCARCQEMDRPAEPPLSPEEIAAQARKFREVLASLKASQAAPPPRVAVPLTRDEIEDRRIFGELFDYRVADAERRERDGDRPSLDVVVAHAQLRARVAVCAMVARPGASPNVKVIDTAFTVAQVEAAWLAAEYAIGLVETRAKRPASVWVPTVNMIDANAPPRMGDEEHPFGQLRARVCLAVNRTGSVVLFNAFGAGLWEWFATAQQACRDALAAPKVPA